MFLQDPVRETVTTGCDKSKYPEVSQSKKKKKKKKKEKKKEWEGGGGTAKTWCATQDYR